MSSRIWRDLNMEAFWAGLSAFLFMIFGALTLQISVTQQFGLSEAQAGSWIFITWLTAGVVSTWFILRYRQPLAIGWTIPGLVYMAALARQFTFEEFVGANLVSGLLIVLLGRLGVGGRIIRLIPMPIIMGMFAASIVGFITRMVDAMSADIALVGPMVLTYLLGRFINIPRLPPVGLAVVTGAVMMALLGRADAPDVAFALPEVALPGVAFSPDAILTVSIPMVVLVLGLGNVQGLGFLIAQGYKVPTDRMTIGVGLMTIVNALLGGHPAAMARTTSAMLGGPAAGPLEKRYWAAIVAFLPAALVALLSGVVVMLIAALPAEYVLAVGGLAILASFEDALVRAFSGPLHTGAAVAFAVTLSSFAAAGIPAEFWALLAGIAVSVAIERHQLVPSSLPVGELATGGAASLTGHEASKRELSPVASN